ncbi:MAG: hypothetical protein NDI62_01685 [Burkholderiales bacterium]|nr:hypothetical protein [Burkholderiales bacterium]
MENILFSREFPYLNLFFKYLQLILIDKGCGKEGIFLGYINPKKESIKIEKIGEINFFETRNNHLKVIMQISELLFSKNMILKEDREHFYFHGAGFFSVERKYKKKTVKFSSAVASGHGYPINETISALFLAAKEIYYKNKSISPGEFFISLEIFSDQYMKENNSKNDLILEIASSMKKKFFADNGLK